MQKGCVTVLHNVTTYMQYIRSPYHTTTLKHEGQLAPFLFNNAFNLCLFLYHKKYSILPSDFMSTGEGRKKDKSANLHVFPILLISLVY